MKKINFKSWRISTKMVLPIFLLIGFFLLSTVSVNAQRFVSNSQAKEIIEKHLSKLPHNSMASLSAVQTKRAKKEPRSGKDTMDSIRRMFGELMMKKLAGGQSVKEALEQTYEQLKTRYESNGAYDKLQYLNMVKDEYKKLLAK